ncbi:MAG: MarR family transcriptional regulator [Acidobacteria bacterium]|nr:MAG: MarR family transcriptional regulator [Acidobacteriota bacterium]
MPSSPNAYVQTVRNFNRFYTRQIGLLNEGLLDSPFSLTEVRALYELAHRERPTASDLCKDLGLDAGYASRILRSFEKQGLIEKKPSPQDARQSLLSLTGKGRKIFEPLDTRSDEQVDGMLKALSPAQQENLARAMRVIEAVLGGREKPEGAYVLLRQHRPGDMGWVVQRHGELYWQEYQYDERFEALVAKIAGDFVEKLVPARERCWIAERNGERAGSVFLVQKSKTISKLRLLLVEPSARGLGIGGRLVYECVRFAREVGYKKMMLWTQSELTSARAIYQKAGFQLVAKKRHQSWGRKDLVAETWELAL